METHIVKVFGERNTGTRALGRLLKQVPGLAQRVQPRRAVPPVDGAIEAAIEQHMRGHWKRLYLHALRDDITARYSGDDPWKHAMPRLTPAMAAARVQTIILVRNPYSWLLALARRPYHIKGPNAATLEGFAARPWMTERREGLPAVLASPLDLWSRKMRGTLTYLAAAQDAGLGCEILAFENFVQDPAGCAEVALRRLGVEPDGLEARPRNTKAHEADLQTLQRYYRTEAWRTRFTRDTVARVNARVDWGVAEALGYARLDPEAFPCRLDPGEEAAMSAEMASLAAPSHREAGAAATT